MVKMAWNYRLYTGYCRKYIKMKNFASCLNFGNLWSWTRKTWNDYLFSFLLFLFVWWKNNSSGALPAGAKEMLLPGHHLTWWKGKLCFTKPSNLFICYLIFGYLGVPAVIFNSFKWTRNVPGSQSEKHAFGDQWWFWTFLRNAFSFTKPIWLSSRHLQNQVFRKFTMFYPTFLRRYSHNPPSPAGPAPESVIFWVNFMF